MSLTLELKNIGKFFLRRKWIILGTTILALSVGILLNNRNNEKNNIVDTTASQLDKYYISEFGFSVEKTDGSQFAGTAQLKTMMLTEEYVTNINKLGDISIDQNQLDQTVNAFVRANKGEILYIRIKNQNKEYVEKISKYYFEQMNDKEFPFFKNKNIIAILNPTSPTTEIPYYNDIHTTTDKSMIGNANTVPAENASKKISLTIVTITGLIAGIVIALVIDIFNKKIYSIGYIESIAEPEVKILDVSYEKTDKIIEKISLLNALGASGKGIVLYQSIKSSLVSEIEKIDNITIDNHLSVESLENTTKVFILVEKGETEVPWLKEQLSFFNASNIQVEVIFY